MREIGSIAGEKEARALADYLLTRDITTKLVAGKDGWVVWVHREDQLPEARRAIEEFRLSPADPRFQSAAPTARAIRKGREKEEADYRRRTRDLRDRWEGSMYRRAPLAFGLIVASIAVFLAEQYSWRTFDLLAFSTGFIDAEGFPHENGLADIRKGEAWRLITPIFLHFGFFHIFFNMIAMRHLGERVEMRKGTWKFGLLVLVSAIASNSGQYLQSHGHFGGMSGVVFAVAGYLWVKGQVQPEDGLSLDNRSFNNLLIWFVAGFALPILMPDGRGFPFNMANIAHGVGLATGVLFGLLRF